MSGSHHHGSWAEAGALLGTLGGILEGLQAVGPCLAPPSRMLVALLGPVAVGALAGAAAVPLALALLLRESVAPAGEPGGPSPLAVRILRPAAVVLCAPPLALFGHELVAVLLPSSAWTVRSLAAVGILAGAAALLRAALRRAAGRWPRPTFAGLAAAAVLAIVAGLLRTAPPVLAEEIDRGDRLGPTARAAATRPNVLLVVLDTTRADHLSVYGYPRRTTPFLEELARESTVFDLAVSAAPWTLPAHASIFTGQPPSVHGATKDRVWLGSESATLAELLRAEGYATVGFSSAGMVSSTFNMHQGFERFYETFRYPVEWLDPAERLTWSRILLRPLGAAVAPDKGAWLVNELARRWLDEWGDASPGRPFFMFVNYFEAHLPYQPPASFRREFVPEPVRPGIRSLAGERYSHEAIYRAIGRSDELAAADYAQLAALYDASLAYQDARLRELVEDLRRRRLLDRTVVAVVSDHGENLGEHGGLLGHAFSVHQTLLRVPLLLRYPPGFPAGLRYPGLVATTSLFPTILDLAGGHPSPAAPPAVPPLPRAAGDPPAPFVVSEYGIPVFELHLLAHQNPGVSIAPFLRRQRAIQDGAWKLIEPAGARASLFHLATDPSEERPLPPESRPEGAVLAAALAAEMARHPQLSPVPMDGRKRIDERTFRALQAVGYVQ